MDGSKRNSSSHNQLCWTDDTSYHIRQDIINVHYLFSPNLPWAEYIFWYCYKYGYLLIHIFLHSMCNILTLLRHLILWLCKVIVFILWVSGDFPTHYFDITFSTSERVLILHFFLWFYVVCFLHSEQVLAILISSHRICHHFRLVFFRFILWRRLQACFVLCNQFRMM